jgi:putative redox protein
MTVALYARRKDWTVRAMALHLHFSRVDGTDGTRRERIDWRIELDGDLTSEQRTRLIEIAQRCPMHRTLAPAITIGTMEG